VSYAFKFGTAGIRARLGAKGTELNLESVRVIAHAIVMELATLGGDVHTRGIAVAFDGRRESRAFAEQVCGVALAQGFRVGLFELETPTPLLAFTTRRQGRAAGIMITASHNPAEDNGIKLYLSGGRQVSAPYDAQIEARIESACAPALIRLADLERARSEGLLSTLGEPELTAYLAQVRSLLPRATATPALSFAYSALYGVGSHVTRRLVGELGGLCALEVEAHATLRSDFGGLASPNPEEPLALVDLARLAEHEKLGLAFAHDPDADRLAVLARGVDGKLRSLSGDEVGALLGDFLLSQHPAPATTLLVSTLVSGGLLEAIADSYGASFVRAPTGFKWIAALGRERAEAEQRELLFGYEEALGYAFFAMADDKDGIAALAVLCRLAQALKADHESLPTKLASLNRQHGVFATRQLSLSINRVDGPQRIDEAMGRLRALSAEALLGAGATLVDYASGRGGFPLLVFAQLRPGALFGTRVCVRPSGTEPKLKLYLHARELPAHGDQDLEGARERAEARLTQVANALAPYLSA
jgi:phosphomannomutase